VRFEFLELPIEDAGSQAQLARPVVPVQVDDLEAAPQICLVDSGAATNRFGVWLADAIGIDLTKAPETNIVVGGMNTRARHGRCNLTIAGFRYDAPVSFCDPWPLSFHLLGQEGFLRFFRVTLCAAEGWLDIEPEAELG
jgi:hypothetical protein